MLACTTPCPAARLSPRISAPNSANLRKQASAHDPEDESFRCGISGLCINVDLFATALTNRCSPGTFVSKISYRGAHTWEWTKQMKWQVCCRSSMSHEEFSSVCVPDWFCVSDQKTVAAMWHSRTARVWDAHAVLVMPHPQTHFSKMKETLCRWVRHALRCMRSKMNHRPYFGDTCQSSSRPTLEACSEMPAHAAPEMMATRASPRWKRLTSATLLAVSTPDHDKT